MVRVAQVNETKWKDGSCCTGKWNKMKGWFVLHR